MNIKEIKGKIESNTLKDEIKYDKFLYFKSNEFQK